MRSGRSYRPALGDLFALTHLQEHAGRLYDSRCVEAIRRIAEGGVAGRVTAGVTLHTPAWAEQA